MWNIPKTFPRTSLCHVDSAQGLCLSALLAACLDALYDNDSERNNFIDILQGYISKKILIGSISQKHNNNIETKMGYEIYLHRESSSFVGLALSLEKVNNDEGSSSSLFVEDATTNHQSSTAQYGGVSLRQVETLLISAVQQQEESNQHLLLPDWVKDTFIEILHELVTVESKVRALENSSNELQMNELDIFIILGILLCLDSLGVNKVSYTPIVFAFGGNDFSNPLEEAITKELLLGMMVIVRPQCTDMDQSQMSPPSPVGLAVLRVLSKVHRHHDWKKCQSVPMVVRAIGTGYGNHISNANVVITIGEPVLIEPFSNCTTAATSDNSTCSLWSFDGITHLETNLDDDTGESVAFVMELLLKNNALDAWATPIVMKKGRPGITLHCLCQSDQGTIQILLGLFFRHTSTLGVRINENLPRAKLERSFVTVQTPYRETTRKGFVDVKISKFRNGETRSMKAEFDHCKEIANETGVPLKLVAESAVSLARENLSLPPPSG